MTLTAWACRWKVPREPEKYGNTGGGVAIALDEAHRRADSKLGHILPRRGGGLTWASL
jgi:3-oxoacyl-[acyl-carrier-protein] synthase III